MANGLKADTLYLGDNGRCFCGELKCAGMTAHATGRDLSGQKAMAITAEMVKAEPFAASLTCEGCGKPCAF